ncbi:hypothetical protein F5X99DRAFT_199857 [Biscogniauxia marginata]|nr:hypothetical protein F5X99DRAFT_199857 [Biscogniauxia marginata]
MASGNPSGLGRDPRSLLQKGMAYYFQEKYVKAIVVFTQVANACSCAVRVWKQSCPCKSLLGAIENDTLKDELKKKCICSAKSDRRCKNVTHLEALDSLAAAHEKDGRLDQALCDAEMMIALSPREVKGYLRLGKVLRLKKSNNLAYLAYLRGAQLVAEKNPNHHLLPKLRELSGKARSLFKVDPIAKLPIELVVMIFKHVGFRSLCRSLRVSKKWKDYLTASKEKVIRDLWRAPTYTYGPRQSRNWVTQSAFRTYSSYCGHQITELTVDDCHRFGLNQNKLHTMLSLCPRLNSLILRGQPLSPLDKLPDHIHLPKLTRIYLGQNVACTVNFFDQILTASTSTLTELSIFGIATMDQHWPMLDKLKVIRLRVRTFQQPFDLPYFMSRMPNVEEVWINNVDIQSIQPLDQTYPWKRLKSLFLKDIHLNMFDGGNFEFLHPEIRELCLEGDRAHYLCYREAFPTEHNTKHVMLGALRKFAINTRRPLTQEEFEHYVRAGIASGSLRELDLKPFPPAALNRGNKNLDWFKSEHVTFLGLSRLSAEVGNSIDNADDALLALVDRFPNLQALDIGLEAVENATLGKIIKKGVKTIYHRAGHHRDEVKHWAQRFDAKVIDGPYPHTPSQHPDFCGE